VEKFVKSTGMMRSCRQTLVKAELNSGGLITSLT
jgi:hypothetical protein